MKQYVCALIVLLTVQTTQIDTASRQAKPRATKMEQFTSTPPTDEINRDEATQRLYSRIKRAQDRVDVLRRPWVRVKNLLKNLFTPKVERLKIECRTNQRGDLTEYANVRREMRDLRMTCMKNKNEIIHTRDATVAACRTYLMYAPDIEDFTKHDIDLPYLNEHVINFAENVRHSVQASSDETYYFPAILPTELLKKLDESSRVLDEYRSRCLERYSTEEIEVAIQSTAGAASQEVANNAGPQPIDIGPVTRCGSRRACAPQPVRMTRRGTLGLVAAPIAAPWDIEFYHAQQYPRGVTRTGRQGYADLKPHEAETRF